MQIMFAGLGGLRTAVGIIADKHLVAVALEMILLAIMHFCGALTEGGSAPPEALLHD